MGHSPSPAEIYKQEHVQESIKVIEKALEDVNFQNFCVSFNGGKDCTVVLHLVQHVYREVNTRSNVDPIDAFYAQLPNSFEEENKFVLDMVDRYNLNLFKSASSSIKESLTLLKKQRPEIVTIFMGTRKDDLKPGSDLNFVKPTDESWPKFFRINPILNWTYKQVWDFILQLDVPYCDLYNQGYSSLGTKDNTFKNAKLLRYHKDETPYFLPAWHLTDIFSERQSRKLDST